MKGYFNNIKLSGVATAVPIHEFDNEELVSIIGEKAVKKQIKATGIRKRRLLSEGQRGVDLCLSAAEKLLAELSWNPKDIKLIVYSSVYSLYSIPATAYYIQKMIGAPTDCLAYDIRMACSGFVNGIINMGSLMQNFSCGDKALLFTASEASGAADGFDRETASLFGDGASVSAWEIADNQNVIFETFSDGNRYSTLLRKEFSGPLVMNGMEVFNFAISDVADSINSFFDNNKLDRTQIDINIIHQAQKYIVDKIADFCNFDMERTPFVCGDFGNTSATSIPLTMCLDTDIDWKESKKIFMTGYGAGLSWANMYIETDNVKVLPVIITDKIWER